MAGPLSYNGAAFLFSGLSQAGQSLGSGIGQGLGRFFDEKALKRLIDDLRKQQKDKDKPEGSLPGLPPPLPDYGPITAPTVGYDLPRPMAPMEPGMSYDLPRVPNFTPGMGYDVPGYQSGGYTGPGAPDEPAGIVHRNEYVVPSDQVQDAGGPQMIEALLSGLSRNPRAASAPGFAGIANLAQMWEKRKEEEKAIGTTGKALKQIFKSNPDLLQGAGLMPEQLENLGHRDVIGLFEGMQQAQAMQAKAAGMKELAARLLQQQQAAAQQQAISQDFARFATALPGAQRDAQATAPELGAYYDSTSTEMPQPPDVAAASHPRAIAELSARFGMAPQHNNFNDYVKLLAPPSADTPFEFNPSRDVVPVPQLPGTYFGRSNRGGGQFLQTPEALAAAETARYGARGEAQKGVIDARAEKLNADTLASLSKELRELDADISAHGRAVARVAKEGGTAPPETTLQELQARRRAIIKRLTMEETPAKAESTPATEGQKLTVDQARQLLQEAGGDKAKARALAKQRGYTF